MGRHWFNACGHVVSCARSSSGPASPACAAAQSHSRAVAAGVCTGAGNAAAAVHVRMFSARALLCARLVDSTTTCGTAKPQPNAHPHARIPPHTHSQAPAPAAAAAAMAAARAALQPAGRAAPGRRAAYHAARAVHGHLPAAAAGARGACGGEGRQGRAAAAARARSAIHTPVGHGDGLAGGSGV